MEISESLSERFKKEIPGYQSTISIDTTLDKDIYRVNYIEVSFIGTHAPFFSYSSKYMNISSEIRDMNIDKILSYKEPEYYFVVESLVYTEEQRERLYRLRNEVVDRSEGFRVLENIKIDYSNSFRTGQRVYYNNTVGVITFKHENSNNKEQMWSIKIDNIEYRYIKGSKLLKRAFEDLSHIEIDKELNKIPTDKLLKMYRKGMKVNCGRGDIKIKRILNDREHIEKKGEVKIINWFH
jgi:hypothetical protein